MTDPLGAATARGATVSLAGQVLRLGIGFAFQVLLSRLLVPADFGLVAMVAPVVALVGLLTDFGLTQATVQSKTISQRELSQLFWLNVLAGLGLAAIAAALAPAIAALYHEHRLVPIVYACGATIFIGSLGAQQLAVLNRQLDFVALVKIDLAAAVAGAACGLAAAAAGWHYWAILVAQAATAVTTVALAWASCDWRPSPPRFRSQGTGSLLHFGANLTAFNFVNFLSRNLDAVLIGRYLGEAPLGIYDRAYKLLLLPITQVTTPFGKVAIPVLSQSVDDRPRYVRLYLAITQAVLMLVIPPVVFSACVADLLVTQWLGPQWADVAGIYMILAIGGLFGPISHSTSWLLISQGRVQQLRNYGLASAAGFLASFAIGLPWGITGVASAYIAVGVVQGPITWYLTTRSGPLDGRTFVLALAPYFLSSAIVAASLVAVRLAVADSPSTVWWLLVLTYVEFFAILLAFPWPRRAAVAGSEVLAGFRRRSAPPASSI